MIGSIDLASDLGEGYGLMAHKSTFWISARAGTARARVDAETGLEPLSEVPGSFFLSPVWLLGNETQVQKAASW